MEASHKLIKDGNPILIDESIGVEIALLMSEKFGKHSHHTDQPHNFDGENVLKHQHFIG